MKQKKDKTTSTLWRRFDFRQEEQQKAVVKVSQQPHHYVHCSKCQTVKLMCGQMSSWFWVEASSFLSLVSDALFRNLAQLLNAPLWLVPAAPGSGSWGSSWSARSPCASWSSPCGSHLIRTCFLSSDPHIPGETSATLSVTCGVVETNDWLKWGKMKLIKSGDVKNDWPGSTELWNKTHL